MKLDPMVEYALLWLWASIAETLSLPLRGLLVALGWITFNDEFWDEGFHVYVYRARGFFFEHLWPKRVTGVAWLPGTIILSPTLYFPSEMDHKYRVIHHELSHCRQWRKWSLLFPLAYGIAALLAWPNCYANNCFEVAARAAVEKAYPK